MSEINFMHVCWAQSHDWYAGCERIGLYDEYLVAVQTVTVTESNCTITEIKQFDNINELKAWAGY